MVKTLNPLEQTVDLPATDLLPLMRQRGLIDGHGWQVCPLAGDGSSRKFYRIFRDPAESLVAMLPAPGEKGLAEARAAYRIGSHLRMRGIPVPEIRDFDERTGMMLMEDLGDRLLHHELCELRHNNGRMRNALAERYRQIIDLLIYQQISGSIRFNRQWSWESERYDQKVMLEKEAAYFINAFCRGYLGITDLPVTIDREFQLLASRAGKQPAVYFLHRDFQCRNVMVRNDEFRIIDFQSGRLGPLGYDLASLLIDPYADLEEELQEELLEYYCDQICHYGLDDRALLKGYESLALQRNLQILGAFAFLTRRQGKSCFRQYIPPALATLRSRLAGPAGNDYHGLRQLGDTCFERLQAVDGETRT